MNYIPKLYIIIFFTLILSFNATSCNKNNLLNNPDDIIEEVIPSQPSLDTILSLNGSFKKMINKTIKSSNYLQINYESEVALKGNLKYIKSNSNTSKNATFFLEASNYGIFNLIIEDRNSNFDFSVNDLYIESLTISNLENKKGSVQIKDLKFTFKNREEDLMFLENDNLKVGINLRWGGAIFYLENKTHNIQQVNHLGEMKIGINYDQLRGATVVHSKDINLLNFHDVGRLVQQSYYGTTKFPYVTGTYLGISNLPYNPVQGGDQKENESKLIDFTISPDTIYIKCQPRDWAPALITSSYMENTYILHDYYLEIKNKFTDYSAYIPEIREQECPAIYAVRNFEYFAFYDGSKPFSNDTMTKIRTKGNDAENRLIKRNMSEYWGGLVNKENFGVGIYVPNLKSGIFSTFGYANISNPTDKLFNIRLSKHPATSYMTLITKLAFKSFKPVEYTSFLTSGNIEEMRNIFYQLNSTGINNSSLIKYDYEDK